MNVLSLFGVKVLMQVHMKFMDAADRYRAT